MAKSMFSASWYRVAQLKPRLRSHIEIHRQRFRGQIWYVLQDHASGRFHRFSDAGHLIIGLMDGTRSVQRIWEIAGEQLGDALPTQDEVLRLLGQLHAADALHGELPPDVAELAERSRKHRRGKFWRNMRNPLAVRFPLLDPDRFLETTLPFVKFAFTPFGFLVWLVICAIAAAYAGAHWSELTDNITERVLAAESVASLLIIYPVVKALHELGHGYAVKRWGGEVHEMGVMLLVLMPVPYVDATAASAFPEKWRRALVGAAGIMVEMLIAAIALFVWLAAEPGLVRAFAFNVMLIAGVSTVLFNGNPLLRFDGYYVLADLIEIPNLAIRANRYITHLARRHLLGVDDPESPADGPGERVWFVTYGVAAFVYRVFIMVVIAMFVAAEFFFIGVLLVIWSCVLMYGVPLWKIVRYLLNDPTLHTRRRRALTVGASAVLAPILLLVLIPLPYGTVTEGVVWVPERARVYAETDGFVTKLLAVSGQNVRKDEKLIVLDDPLLKAQVRIAAARVQELELRHAAARVTDLADARIIQDGIDRAKRELAWALRRVRDLSLASPVGGRLVVPNSRDLPDRFVRQGDLLAYVIENAGPIIRVVVPQTRIDLVRNLRGRVDVRLIDRFSAPIEAAVVREVPAASTRLPSMSLSTEGGGALSLDPEDPSGRKAVDPFFQFELRLPAASPIRTIGGRAYVRFDHGAEPLAWRAYREIRQVFLSHFNV